MCIRDRCMRRRCTALVAAGTLLTCRACDFFGQVSLHCGTINSVGGIDQLDLIMLIYLVWRWFMLDIRLFVRACRPLSASGHSFAAPSPCIILLVDKVQQRLVT